MATRLELNREDNPLCSRNCNKEIRQNKTENDLCVSVKSAKDNLPVRCVGAWAEEKIYLLYQYFGIFAGGMKYKWKLNYIEICSGPGRCINRSSGQEFDGTAISILQHKCFEHINQAIFYDYNDTVVETLNQRIQSLGLSHKAIAKHGDYNNPTSITNDLSQFSNDCLNLILIDPTDCSVPFSLLESIASCMPKFDLIINIATKTDFNRNIPMAFSDPTRAEKYIRFLGSDNFFNSRYNQALCDTKDYASLRIYFRESYKQSLQRIGFNHFDYTPIRNFYDILFATSSSKGIEFWKKATKEIDSSGQRSLLFE